MVKLEFEKAKIDIEKFSNASKAMDKLIKAQIQDKLKRGIGYHATPPLTTITIFHLLLIYLKGK